MLINSVSPILAGALVPPPTPRSLVELPPSSVQVGRGVGGS